MSRNSEKHHAGLNRVHLEKQWSKERELKRPPLRVLKTAADVRQWIPSIKRDRVYYLNQLSGVRKHSYTPTKIKEFEEKLHDIEREYKQFVNKVFELDKNQNGVPWEPKAYVSKRKLKEDHERKEGNDDGAGCSMKKKSKPIILNILEKEKEYSEE